MPLQVMLRKRPWSTALYLRRGGMILNREQQMRLRCWNSTLGHAYGFIVKVCTVCTVIK